MNQRNNWLILLGLAGAVLLVYLFSRAPAPFAPLDPTPVQPTSAFTQTTKGNNDSQCVSWREAYAHVGERTCVSGTVTSTYDAGNAFFINFSSNRTTFYLVSFDFTFNQLQGRCVIATGEIVTYEGRPEIIIRDTDQLTFCP